MEKFSSHIKSIVDKILEDKKNFRMIFRTSYKDVYLEPCRLNIRRNTAEKIINYLNLVTADKYHDCDRHYRAGTDVFMFKEYTHRYIIANMKE